MSLKQIIIFDEEDHTKVTIEASQVEYKSEEIVDGRLHIKLGTRKSMEVVLSNFIEEEWIKIKDFGARLVTRIPKTNRLNLRFKNFIFTGSLIPFVLWLLFIILSGR